jgi:hypothetical protein
LGSQETEDTRLKFKMKVPIQWITITMALTLSAMDSVRAGPYSAGLDDSSNSYDAPVPGFVGTGGDGVVVEGNFVNPLFFGWADGVTQYAPAPGLAAGWTDPSLTLGPVTGDVFNIASLGDLNQTQLDSNITPGQVTLSFQQPVKDLSGADFVVYENALGTSTSVFAELAYVEVSSDGIHFARFPSRSLTPSAVGQLGYVNPTNILNLAGKHINSYGKSWGTPFDLSQLATDALVTGGQVDLNDIRYVRLIDIPGNGSFLDSTGAGIYDAWITFGSGGLDLDAIGVISRPVTYAAWAEIQDLPTGLDGPDDDADGDGLANLLEYAHGRMPGRADSAQAPLSVAWVAESEVPGAPVRMAVTFTRDERASDLIYEIEASNGGFQAWSTIARSTGGQPFAGTNGHSPAIQETSASSTASVGVLRKVTLVDVEAVGLRNSRFLRLKVTRIP